MQSRMKDSLKEATTGVSTSVWQKPTRYTWTHAVIYRTQYLNFWRLQGQPGCESSGLYCLTVCSESCEAGCPVWQDGTEFVGLNVEHGRDKYGFNDQGQGCRFWVGHQMDLFYQHGFLLSRALFGGSCGYSHTVA
ncbi:hypothetical protein BJX96DRAFT_134926 [Aspergillus floccosus]